MRLWREVTALVIALTVVSTVVHLRLTTPYLASTDSPRDAQKPSTTPVASPSPPPPAPLTPHPSSLPSASAAGQIQANQPRIPIKNTFTPKNAAYCTYTDGVWVGNLTWHPVTSARCPYREFDQEQAFECLGGKLVVLFGKSNTRALYSALEGILKNKTITPRLEAKQACENNPKNHSCGMTVELPGYRPVNLFYWGYARDVWEPRLAQLFQYQRHADVVVGNAGADAIQKHREWVWKNDYKNKIPSLNRMWKDAFSPKTEIYWHTTTRICEAQKHFRRFTYKKSYWKGRTLEQMNTEIAASNQMVISMLDHNRVRILDTAGMASNPALCAYYDDPLHHKAVDRGIAQVLLNMHCPAKSA
eukprot:Sspe_Gene.55692::Locus_30628_Transcript_1_1_Confidence_1.000_Length_1204::g.55692::m.55692